MEEEEIPIAIWHSAEFDVLAVIFGENMGRQQSRLVNINNAILNDNGDCFKCLTFSCR